MAELPTPLRGLSRIRLSRPGRFVPLSSGRLSRRDRCPNRDRRMRCDDATRRCMQSARVALRPPTRLCASLEGQT
eukprot:6214833-Pleurochrysis_carterae.AAC.3